MTYSKILGGTLIAATALFTGLTAVSAQNATDTAPAQPEQSADKPQAMRGEMRMGRGGHHGRGGMFGQIMQQADADDDGAVTQAEIDAFRAEIVANADASGEGDISLDEFEEIYLQLTRTRMVRAFQSLDTDGDGVVTQAEMDSRFGKIVERMDRNDDGKLDRNDRGRKGQGRMGKRDGKRCN